MKTHLGVLLLITGLTGCASSGGAPPMVTAAQPPASATIAWAETLTATASPVPSSTNAKQVPELILTSSTIVGLDWSPDGQWIGFWVDARDPDDPNPPDNPMKPGFYELATGRICYQDDMVGTWYPEYPPSFSYWEPDGSAIVVVDKRYFKGTPCGEFTPISVDHGLYALETHISPDGSYRAQTLYQDKPVTATTTLIDAASGAVVNRVAWEWRGRGLGGWWIGDDQFLIRQTADRGPLLLKTDGATVEVLPEMFKAPGGSQFDAYGALDMATGHYHILLDNDQDLSSPLRLYHSETGEVEEIPFRAIWNISTPDTILWGFSPDGGWLTLQDPDRAGSSDEATNWVRPVDGSDSEARIFSRSFSTYASNRAGLLAADADWGGGVDIVTFPDGKVVQRWGHDWYGLSVWGGWSPDGRKLLLHGYLMGNSDYTHPRANAIFIADVQP